MTGESRLTTDKPLEAQDTDVRHLSMQHLGSEIRILDDIILKINGGTAALTGYKHDRGLNFLAGLLVNKGFNSLWRAREDAVSGYPVQSLTLCRAALEDWASLYWVELHPESVDRWLWPILEGVEQPKEWPPRFKQIWDELSELGDLGKVTKAAYSILSEFAHPRGTGLRWLIHFDSESTTFHYGPHFDLHNLRACMFFLIQVAQGFLERIAQLQVRALGSVDAEWVTECRELSMRARAFLDEVADEILPPDDELSSLEGDESQD